tara:strand:- start:106 stop:675 length:570 start_codon:yes stop_codon:yes gene_type:complete
MPIVINGSGTVSGISAGGLPDGCVDADTLASGVGGKILQVVTATSTTHQSTTSYSWVDTNLSASITPSASSSKVYVLVQHAYRLLRSGEYDVTAGIQLLRGSTVIQSSRERSGGGGKSNLVMGVSTSANSAYLGGHYNIQHLDSPNTTSSTTYKTQYAADWSTTINLNQADSVSTALPYSVMTLMEVAA